MVCRHLYPRRSGLSFLFSTGCALLTALLFMSCSSSGAGTSNATATSSAASPTLAAPTSTPQVASTVVTALTPVMTPLASPPQNCPIKDPPQQKHLDSLGANNDVTLLGGGVFWIYGGFYSSVLHLNRQGSDQKWPMTKWVVEVGPNFSSPVTLRLQEMRTKALVWWTDAQTPPHAATQTLILDPRADGEDVGSVPGVPDVPHGSPNPGWSEWGLFPLFPVAGCYTLEASWPGGSWQSVMAVGS